MQQDRILKEIKRREELMEKQLAAKKKRLEEEIKTREKIIENLEIREKELNKSATPKGHPDWFIVEENINGTRAMLHKKGNQVKFFNSKKGEMSLKDDNIFHDGVKLSDKDLIVDGVIQNNIFYCSDILYSNRLLTDESWPIRKTELRSLKFTDSIKEVPSHLAKNRKDLTNFIDLVSKNNRSNGAVIKQYDSTYPLAENNWILLRNLGPDQFEKREDAIKRAGEIGCSGSHTHNAEGKVVFMPCKSHEEWKQKVGRS